MSCTNSTLILFVMLLCYGGLLQCFSKSKGGSIDHFCEVEEGFPFFFFFIIAAPCTTEIFVQSLV